MAIIDKNPLVSVIIPVYNAEKYVSEAIRSIEEQTYRQLEIIVIDDGSSDGTYKIVNELAHDDPRIILVSRENRGLQVTLNELIAMSTGKYIARMDADDISLPERIEKQVRYMEEHPEVGALGSYVRILGTQKVIARPSFRYYETRRVRMLFENIGIPHPSAMMRASSLKEANIEYNVNNKAAEDYELWWDIMSAGYVVTQLEEVLLDYRVHSEQITSAKVETVENSCLEVQLKILERIGRFEMKDAETLSEWYNQCDLSKYQDYEVILQNIIESNKLSRVFTQWILEAEIMYQWVNRALIGLRCGQKNRMLKWRFLYRLLIPNRLLYVVYELYVERKRILKKKK